VAFGNAQQARLPGEASVTVQYHADVFRHLAVAYGVLQPLLVEAVNEALKHAGRSSRVHCSLLRPSYP
jgi:hypothetical protein